MLSSNELSSDIAIALIVAKDKYPGEPRELKELILKVHSTLRRLAEESRNRPMIVLPLEKAKQRAN